jgi:hypothetical protein
MSEQPKAEVGQIWREVDPRQERYVQVTRVGTQMATVRKVERDAARQWDFAPKSRYAEAQLHRFNGKRGGYEFVEVSA